MSAILELSTAVRTRRSDMGLTQSSVAKLSGLSRATVNQLENGTIKDLSLSRANRLLEALGLAMTVAAPHRRLDPAERKSPALDLAARSASVSFRTMLTPRALREILAGGAVPVDLRPHVFALLDEVPVSLLAAVVEQMYFEQKIERPRTWKRMRELAQVLKSNRELWQ
ncbi:helix-turn-helix domain-containing protein [Variovorax paradoxus]|nr:helix-turn-helix domain-containing protein [Variovorax paradoxus]